MKVEIQRSFTGRGFWVYLIKENGEQFMLRWQEYCFITHHNKIKEQEDAIEQTEKLIKFIKGE